jgi:hypothetical protein
MPVNRNAANSITLLPNKNNDADRNEKAETGSRADK